MMGSHSCYVSTQTLSGGSKKTKCLGQTVFPRLSSWSGTKWTPFVESQSAPSPSTRQRSAWLLDTGGFRSSNLDDHLGDEPIPARLKSWPRWRSFGFYFFGFCVRVLSLFMCVFQFFFFLTFPPSVCENFRSQIRVNFLA